MATKNIAISLLDIADIEEVNNFHNRIYNDQRTEAQFMWEFFHAPAGQAIYVIAKDAETQRIVGTQCAIPIDLITDKGETIRTGKSEDTLVDPAYRGMQIFENMYDLLFDQCRKQGMAYLWGFTTAKKPFMKLGFEIPYDHSQALMVRNISSAYRYLRKLNPKTDLVAQLKIAGLCMYSWIMSMRRNFNNTTLLDKTYPAVTHTTLLATGNDHLIPVVAESGFWIRQDLPYLSWRILSNPYHPNIFNVTFSADSGNVAHLNFNHHKDGVWYLINDAYAGLLTPAQKSAMLSKAITLLINDKTKPVRLIRTWDFTHNAYGLKEVEVRKQAGFVHLDRGISFVWKKLGDDILKATDFNLTRVASQGVI